MKKLKLILSIFVLTFAFGCSEENNDVDLDSIAAPSNISALTTITQDNTGNVTFLPKGDGVTQFEIYFGDTTTAPVFLRAGETYTHKYKEGKYNARIVGMTLNGKRTETTQEVMVSFLAPRNLETNVTIGSNLGISVSAKAELETFFQVYFGDVPNEVPVDFMEGEVVSHTYKAAGTYEVRVVALSGGVAKTEKTQSVTVTNLFAAPAPTIPAC